LPEPAPDRIYVVDLGTSVIACAPADYHERLAAEPRSSALVSPETLGALLPERTRLVGPAFIGYADSIAAAAASADETAASASEPAFDALRRAAATEEWEHAGLDGHVRPIFVKLADGDVIAAAGYERIGVEVAHVGVLTHPDHRAAGHGRKIVAATARLANSRGLLVQYQTLLANKGSIAIGRSLCFEQFATTLAARLPSRSGG
jgi:GNAT superfamily N-acetyltransferase